jgi:hypothetical protein
MSAAVVLLIILSAVALVAAALLVIGWRTQTPPGKQGPKGTGMERSRALHRFQMGLLTLLLLACLLGFAVLAIR